MTIERVTIHNHTEPRSLGRFRTRDIPHALDDFPMPEDEAPGHGSWEAWRELQQMNHDDDWDEELKEELRAAHDRFRKRRRAKQDDTEAEDPNIASGEPVEPGHILEDGPPPGMIRSTGDINRRNRQLHHRSTRDAKRLVIRTLGDLNRHNAITYRKRA